ncbi:MAG: transporter substrate-binding domain-containing protein [Thermotogaceae bacterium]|nr:transporter substrate-binding domain-containing protein [Thermotogaceae bacterium]
MVRRIVFIMVLISSVSFSLTLRVGVYDDYPLVYVKGNKAAGIYVDVLNEIAKKEGWKISYSYYKWEDLFSALEKGQIDCIAAIAETDERKKKFVFNSEPFFQNWGVVVSKKAISSIFDLKGKAVGIVINDVYGNAFKNILKSFSIKARVKETYSSYENIAKDVANDEIDAGVISRISSLLYFSKYGYYISSIVFRPVNLKLAFLKKSKIADQVISKIDEYLKSWKADPDSVYWKSVKSYLNISGDISKKVLIVIRMLVVIMLVFIIVILIQYTFSKKLKEELEKATSEIKKRSEELEKLNKKLEFYLKKAEESFNKSLEIMEHVSQVVNLEIDEEEFMQRLLEIALEYLKPAKYGSMYRLNEKGDVKMVAAVGHDKELFNSHRFKKPFIFYYEKPVVVKDILNVDKKIMDPEDYEVLMKVSKPIKESLILPVFVENDRVGTVVIDISPSENGSFSEHHVKIAEAFSRIGAAFIMIRNYVKIQDKFQREIILALVKALEFYSPYTKGHSERVANLAVRIANEMGLSEDKKKKIYWAGILHDVGKIFVPQDVLHKPDKLTEEEYDLVKLHPVKSAEIIEEIDELKDIAKIVRHHHERCDGKGYPDGLKCSEIPLEARIIAVADAFDAMTSKRPYREALKPEEALNEIVKNSGVQFDPQVVQVFIRVFQKICGQ